MTFDNDPEDSINSILSRQPATMIVTDFQTARSTIRRLNDDWSIDRELEGVSPMYE